MCDVGVVVPLFQVNGGLSLGAGGWMEEHEVGEALRFSV